MCPANDYRIEIYGVRRGVGEPRFSERALV
jgi:hypothetical protein